MIIVGSGVFGLSTTLWLARGGYKDVTIFDRCSFDQTFYNPADGCDGVSADINKIFRATYGAQVQYVLRIICSSIICSWDPAIDRSFSYQDLALEARNIWLEWNQAIKESRPSDLPQPLTPEDELLLLCGLYRMADGPDMIPRYVEYLRAPAVYQGTDIQARSRETYGCSFFFFFLFLT